MRLFHLCLSVCICGYMFGCRQPAPAQPRGYFGPTEPMAQVVEQINRNNAAIPTLRATGNFEATVVDQNRRQFVNGDASLLYRRPDEVRLIGRKDIAGVVFEAGTNSRRYWLIVKGETDTMWFGSHEYLDRVDPKDLPIRPDVLLEVLGVGELDPNFLAEPTPTMRFNNDADAYMFNFNVRLPDRWAVQKEVWYDRETKLPKLVLLFDENGRIVLRAYLSEHRPVEGAPADGVSPRIATRYQLFFPDTRTTMRVDLNDVALRGGRPPAPNDLTFQFPTEPGVARVINLDEQARP